MNDEQTKRVSDAADAVLNARDALFDAREALADKRFDSDQERERSQAVQQAASRIENAAKRVEDALRKGTIAAAVRERQGAYTRYCAAVNSAREARAMARSAPDQDGIAAKREREEAALALLDAALAAAAELVFGA